MSKGRTFYTLYMNSPDLISISAISKLQWFQIDDIGLKCYGFYFINNESYIVYCFGGQMKKIFCFFLTLIFTVAAFSETLKKSAETLRKESLECDTVQESIEYLKNHKIIVALFCISCNKNPFLDNFSAL